MRHHSYNKSFRFIKDPIDFNKNTDKNELQYCLGATLYMPGTKDILDKILKKKLTDLTSFVMCFEDAIQEEDLQNAEENVLAHLDGITSAIEQDLLTIDEIPLMFLRVRNPEQFKSFSKKLMPKHTNVLSGFTFPKFNSHNAGDYFKTLERLCAKTDTLLYGMPILEGEILAHRETRNDELLILKRILKPFKEAVLNIRVGGTDFSSIWGVRRGVNYSIYDILPVRDCLSDILNFFNRADEDYLVSAPVWEYFLAHKQDDINELLKKKLHISLMNRVPIINEAIDGLLREIIIDKANGFVGKTVIHPSHVRFVNAMQVVIEEEYNDAMQILSTSGGVVKSSLGNKMNEVNPHRSWAKKVVNRAAAYGVVKSEEDVLNLIFERDDE
jgi:citrate lyase beta subunit